MRTSVMLPLDTDGSHSGTGLDDAPYESRLGHGHNQITSPAIPGSHLLSQLTTLTPPPATAPGFRRVADAGHPRF